MIDERGFACCFARGHENLAWRRGVLCGQIKAKLIEVQQDGLAGEALIEGPDVRRSPIPSAHWRDIVDTWSGDFIRGLLLAAATLIPLTSRA